MLTLLLAAAVHRAVAAPSRYPVQFVSTPSRSCAVLQAAYTAAIRRSSLAYPPVVRTSWRRLDLNGFTPDARARLPMSAAEYADLAAHERRDEIRSFRPACRWQGQPGPRADDQGHATYTHFTSPIFSTDGSLAITEVSFGEAGAFGYGLVCTARRHRGRWTARCRDGWIS